MNRSNKNNSDLNELMALLEIKDIDSNKGKLLKSTFEKAVDQAVMNKEQFKTFEQLDQKKYLSRAEMLNDLDNLLVGKDFDSRQVKKYLSIKTWKKISLVCIGLAFITLGLGMIIMPAPANFEMFTIFYFSPNDGVTLMDVIALLVVLSGVYLLIKTASE